MTDPFEDFYDEIENLDSAVSSFIRGSLLGVACYVALRSCSDHASMGTLADGSLRHVRAVELGL